MKPKSNSFIRASRLALFAITFGALPAFAGTTWDGGGGATTSIDLAANWGGTVNALDGTQPATFASGGNAASMNVPARFTTLTFNREDAGGFAISGASTLSANQSTAGGTINLGVSDTAGNGVTSISSAFQVNTDAGGGTRLLNIKNDEKDVPAGSLLVSGGISASTAANTYVIRAGGTGVTVLSGTLSHVAGIQQVNSGISSGKVIVSGSQNLGAATVNVPTTTSGTVSSAYTIQMGSSTADVQSWASTTINQNATVSVKSTATLSGGVSVGGATGATGATLVVDGALSATTLNIGSSGVTGNLKIGGSASFSGAVAIGAAAGNLIVGNSGTNGTLSLSSGTISSNVAIGGAGTNENKLNLTKTTSGTLTISGTHPYTGTTTVTAGVLDITGATLSGTSALNVGATGTLGLSVATPSTVPVTATFTPGSQVKLTGTPADDALLLTATGGMSGAAPALSPAVPGFFTKIVGNQLRLKAGTGTLNTWDAGGGGDTNINTAANWGGDILPLSIANVTFGDAGSTATVNVDSQFAGVTFNRADAFNVAGPNNLILSSVNSSGSTNLVVTNAAGGTQTIDAPLQVDTTNTTNKFLSIANNSTSHTLDINGSISRSSSSTADYALRFSNAAGSVTRIDGELNNISGVQQAFGSTAAGDLIFGGTRSSNCPVSIAGSGSGTAPTTTARLFLGETPADIQTWGNLTLNNTIKLVIGGEITAGTLSVGGNATAANTLIVGNSATNSTLSLTGGTISNLVTIGGAGTNENNLNLAMAGSGTLTISGGTHTYTGTTTVSSGTLSLAAAASLASPVIVNDGAKIAGEGTTTGSLTFDAGISTLSFDPATEGSLTAASVGLSGASVLASPTGTTDIGIAYTVLTRSSGVFTAGDVDAFIPGGRGTMGGAGTNEITYTPTDPASLTWKGNDDTNPTFWDVAISLNWDSGGADRFYTGDAVTFNDSASEFNVAVQGTSVSPGDIVFDNTTANPYTVSGGVIGGSGSLTKNNSGTVTLSNSLAHSGGITVNAGILDLGTANNTFSGGINLVGGELKFGGAALPATGSLNSQTVTLGGGTITRTTNATITNDDQNIAIDTDGSTIKVDTSATTTWRIGGTISGEGDWIKAGTGVLALGRFGNTSPANDFTGTVTVTEGTLDIRHSDSLGSTSAGTLVQDAVLMMQNGNQTAGTYTVDEPLDFSGDSFLTGYCQENKAFTQRFNGPVTVAADTTLGISTARTGTNPAPTLELNGTSITTGAGSILSLGTRPASYPAGSTAAGQTVNIAAAITGPGAVTVEGDAGSVYTLGAPGYSGNTTVNSGIEYFMGQSGSGFTALPVPDSTGKVSWTKDPTYSGTFAVQTSPDLSAWTTQAHTVNGNQIEYTLPSGQGKLFVRLLVNPN